MLLKTDGYDCAMGWEGKGGAGAGWEGSGAALQEEPVSARGSRKQPERSRAQNNVLGAGLQQHSLMVAQHWQGNREPGVSALAVLPARFALPLVLAPGPLRLAGSETRCPGWHSISCTKSTSFRGCTLLCWHVELSITRRAAWTQSKQLSQRPLRQLAVLYTNGGQEQYKFFQFPAWGPQRGLRRRRSRDASCRLISVLSPGSGYVLVRSPSCVWLDLQSVNLGGGR